MRRQIHCATYLSYIRNIQFLARFNDFLKNASRNLKICGEISMKITNSKTFKCIQVVTTCYIGSANSTNTY